MMKRAILLAALGTAACTVGPDFETPEIPPPAAGAFVDPGTTQVTNGPVEGQWWRLFRDPVLDRLVTDALTYNSDLRSASANLRRARAVLSEARNQRLPTTQTSGSYVYQRIGANQTGVPDAQSVEGDFFNVGFDASYQVDLFGGVSRSIEAAQGDVAVAQAQLDGARVAVAAETARLYADACGFAEQAAVARETANLQQRTLDLTRRLLEAGRGTQREVDQALVLTENARAQIPQLDAERRASLYALAALTGRNPRNVDADASRCSVPPTVDTLIPIGDGAGLIARRPDIRQAERQLAADTARVGVATAQLYPSISLLGSASLISGSLDQIASSDAFNFSLGPLISWSFPNLGAARARVRQSEAVAEGSLAAFDGTVLNALSEVEQALARYAGELERNVALRRAAAAASNAARIAELRFNTGRDSFLLRLDAERDRAAARAALAQSNATLATRQVALFNALGGGWEGAPSPARALPIGSAAPRASGDDQP